MTSGAAPQHMRYHACALGVQRYEVTVHERYVPRLLRNAYLERSRASGALALKLKGQISNAFHGASPAYTVTGIWQARLSPGSSHYTSSFPFKT